MSSPRKPSWPWARASRLGEPEEPGAREDEPNDLIDETSDESFPASDPPAWIFREPKRDEATALKPRRAIPTRVVWRSARPRLPTQLTEDQMTWFTSSGAAITDAKHALLADNWWIVALRGVLAILFGIGAIVLPGATMLALVTLFGAFAIVDGAFGIAQAMRGARRNQRWGLVLLNGLIAIAIGIAALVWPDLTILAFVLMLAAWALASGALMLGTALRLKTSHGRWLLLFGAVVSILYGAVLLVSPLIGALVLTWWVGAHALILGATLIALAFQLRSRRGGQYITDPAPRSQWDGLSKVPGRTQTEGP